jgi:cysteine desulfurase/selenocysteine lyase
MIYLDNAATSWPKPESVYGAMDGFLRNNAGNPGRGSHSMSLAAAGVVEEARALTAQLFDVEEKERIIFTLNCTDALNLGLKGLLKPGDHVITSSMEHNSVARPLTRLIQQGVKVTRVSPAAGTGIISAGDIESAITEDTRLIVIIHASNVTGVVQPIEEYGSIARKHNLIFMVDAAQSAGKHPIDVQSGKIDLLAFAGHKGLFGPPGTGGLYVGHRVDLDTLREGGTGSYSEEEKQPVILPDKYECGTLNSVGICGLGAGLKFIYSEGLEKIQARERELTARLIYSLANIPKVNLYISGDRPRQSSVISFNIEGYAPSEVGAILDQEFDIKVRTGLHCAPGIHRTLGTFPLGTVRLSPGYFNTPDEMDFTVSAIEKIAAAQPVTASARTGN